MFRSLVVLAGLLIWSLLASPQTTEKPECGKIESVRGPAVVIRDRKVADAKAGDVLRVNDVVQTGAGARMRITLMDGSTLSFGARGELRVIQSDTTAQITLIEMLHGNVRANVKTVTKAGGRFEILTPTARVLAVGTVISVGVPEVETSTSANSAVIDQRTLEDLPLNGRDFRSLLQLEPGIAAGNPNSRSLSDYKNVAGTGVTVEDHYGSVTNFDLNIPGQTDLMPGQYTEIPRGEPPKPPAPMYTPNGFAPGYNDFRQKFFPHFNFDRAENPAPGSRNPDCGRGSIINGVYVPSIGRNDTNKTPIIPQFRTEITGTGISTGNALQVHFYNDSPCPLKFVVTSGAILKPTGFTGRVIEGLILGGEPLKDFQKMYTVGGKVYLKPLVGVAPERNEQPPEDDAEEIATGPREGVALEAAVPAGSETTMMLRSFCVELHKLAPHPKTIYKFADEGDQEKYAPNRALVDRAFHMLLTRQITLPPNLSLDNIVQWMLWAHIEQMNEKRFRDEFIDLVKKNYEAHKQKWDKEAEKRTEQMAQDCWMTVQKVLNPA